MKLIETITVQRPLGLHLEEFTQLVNIAKRFRCRIKVQRAGKKTNTGNSWALLTLAAPPGSELVLLFDGEDVQGASVAVRKLLERGSIEPKHEPGV